MVRLSRQTLDARRLLCPMPVIRTQNLVKTLQAGDIVEVLCTDPGVLHDIPAWCRINGHEVLDTERDAGEIIITVRVG
jgi:tRNA 2-thiouridine synthesizing protein A